MSESDHDRATWRIWALDRACERNKYANIDKVMEEAEKFSQFIERRTDAVIEEIAKRKKK